MDTGTWNCRDYLISPDVHPTLPTTPQHDHLRVPLHRHESWTELETRSRSPASKKPKFPLLRLPLELRLEILSYLLPTTQALSSTPSPLATHALNFGAVQRRMAKGMPVPGTSNSSTPADSRGLAGLTSGDRSPPRIPNASNVVWQKGNTSLLQTCRQLHDECADIIYGANTFVLFVTFSGITVRLRCRLSSGVTPTKTRPFLAMPDMYIKRIKRMIVHVDHVDSYTGMIKFNVSGKGLVHGLRKQVERLITALSPCSASAGIDGAAEESHERTGGLTDITIRVSNGNAITDSLNSRFSGAATKVSDDIDTMLEPFGSLGGITTATVLGAVSETSARQLEARMRDAETGQPVKCCCRGGMADSVVDEKPVQLCVYGNDI
nr:hypothetical protein B0A51_10187 [Rachicladosporium sp. CCFEE 5018]